jgi:hypothetical protein
MISCSPTSSDTAAHNLDTASNPSSQSHFTKDIPSNVLQVRTRSTTKKSHHCQENHNGYQFRPLDPASFPKQWPEFVERGRVLS